MVQTGAIPAIIEDTHVSKLPREPFLPHSEVLINHLLSFAPGERARVLEIGCGPQSPLLPILLRRWKSAHFHQIDAQPEVVAEATKLNPQGLVEQMLASDMSAIPANSKDLVIAMSVFDQNSTEVLGPIAGEIHRVLADGGMVVYIHNEELNLPAMAASMLQHAAGPRILLPGSLWEAANDLEYCSAEKSTVEAAMARHGAELVPILWFLRGVLPELFGGQQASTAQGKIAVPFLRECTPEVMRHLRHLVAIMRDRMGVPVTDHKTADLLKDLIEDRLFRKSHGFNTLCAGVFELRRCEKWQALFNDRPPRMHFVRGVARFGCALESTPAPIEDFSQELNSYPERQENEVMLVAYQYGFIAQKTARP